MLAGIKRELRKRNLSALIISFDPTAASADTGMVLPKNAIPLHVQSLGGATGGANPTVDIGTAADPDGFANELDADGVATPQMAGALIGVQVTAPTPVYAGVGASAAGGGTTTVVLTYVINDADNSGE